MTGTMTTASHDPAVFALQMVACCRAARAVGLPPSEFLCLCVLAAVPSKHGIAGVSRQLGHHRTHTRALLENLVNAGYVAANFNTRPYAYWATRKGAERVMEILKRAEGGVPA